MYLHQLNPFAIQLSETFGIRWYGLAYLSGFMLGYFIIRFMVRRGISPVPMEIVGDLVFSVALGTVIGGRLGYCIFYSPNLFTEFRSSIPFWGVLAVNEGGMASHGGIVGIVVACILFARLHRLPALHLMDLMTLGGTLGIFFGRIANFVNGELVGRVISHPIAWAVKFPQDLLLWTQQEPERLTTLLPVVKVLGITDSTWTETCAKFAQDRTAWTFINNTLSQILAKVQMHDSAIISALTPLLDARHPSQIYEALLEGLLLFVVLIFMWRIPRKPGVITGLFFVGYAIVRVIGEQFRMPDAQIGYQLFGLTRGQWLSLVMLSLGLAFLQFVRRRSTDRLGGWASIK